MANTLATIFGVVFLLLGLAGFVGNPLVGANALFEANSATNWLHLVAGLILLATGYFTKAEATSLLS